MSLTYQDYLNEQNKESEVKTPTKTKSYTYSDYLAELETEKRSKAANPAMQPSAEDLKLTGAENLAKNPLTQIVASSGKTFWGGLADIYDKASLIGRTIGDVAKTATGNLSPPIPNKKITEWGPYGAVTKEHRPENIADILARSARGTANQIGEGVANPGGTIDTISSGLTGGAMMAGEMYAMGQLGVPQPAIFPAHSATSALSESAKRGDKPLKQTWETVKGGIDGYVLGKVLNFIPEKTKNYIKQYALNTAALTAIPEVKNAIGRLENGENPLDIDWKSMFKGLGVSALLPLIFGTGVEKPMSEAQIKRTNENTWRIKQGDIQLNAIPDIAAEMTPQQRVDEIQKLTKLETENQLRQAPELTQQRKEEAFNAAFEKSMTDNLNREVKPPEVITATPKPIESKAEPQKTATPPEVIAKTPIATSKPKPPKQIEPKQVELNFEIGDKAIVSNPDGRNRGDYPGEIVGVGELNGVKTFSIKLRKDGSTKIVTADQLSTTKENYFNGMSNQQINEIKSRNKEINEKLWENPIEFSSTDADYKEFQSLQSNKDKSDFILKFHAKRVGIDTFGIDINNPVERIKLFDEIGKLNTAQRVKNKHATDVVNIVKEITNTTEELTEIMGEQATHLGMNLNAQARVAHEVKNDPTIDPDSGLRIGKAVALGKAPVPNIKDENGHLLKVEAVWLAEKQQARKDRDVDYLMELGKDSPVSEQISQAGKSLVLLRNRDPLDPVYQIMEISKEARNTVEKSLGNKKVKAASDRRVAELEKIILEQTKQIEDYKNRKTIKELKYEARKSGRNLTKTELKLEFEDLVGQFEKHASSQMNIGIDPKMIKLMGRMAINKVRDGVESIEQIVDDIYMVVGEKFNIDRRTILNAVSGYGRRSELSKDEIDTKLRELKRQGRLLAQIDDAEKGLASLRSGLERDKPTERVKELTRILEETKRKNGLIIEKELKEKVKRIPPTEEERQLTAIERYRNYINKRTADLEQTLIDGDYSIKKRNVTPIDSELQRRKDHVERLSKIHRNLKEINELRDTGVSRDEAQKLVDLSWDVSTKKELITDPTDRSVDGPAREYGRAKVDFFDEANRLKLRARKLTKMEWVSKLRREAPSTLWHGAKVMSGTSKSILSSMDNSALGRQGIKMLWAHPTVWARNAKQSFVDIWKEMGGKNAMREVLAEIYSRPMSIDGTFDRMKIDIGTMEEAYPEQGLEKVKFLRRPYKASETAFTGFQYRNRADAAEIYYDLAKLKGYDVTNTKDGNKQLENIGHLVNSMTGRGKLGNRDTSTINELFFAPKFLKSNWDFLTMHQGQGEGKFVKIEAAKNWLKFMGGTMALLAAAKAAGADVELNPQSSDFLKIRFGNTRFDITGGMGSVAVVTTRLVGGLLSGLSQLAFKTKPWMTTKSSTTGKLSAISDPKNFFNNWVDVLVDFSIGKLAPGAAIVKTIGTGVGGNSREQITAWQLLINSALPIGWQNMIQNWSIEDKKLWLATTFADTMGIGTSTYGKSQKKFKYIGFK